jgi:ABC-type branched-subunit amino acid transport system substrate-binding protein
MKTSGRIEVIVFAALLLALPALFACNDSNTPEGEKRDVTITVGNLTDKTGVASNAMIAIDTALNDTVEYYNENNLIPGVKLKVISYDEQYDPSRDIPGYEWLREKGADLIWTPVPSAVPTLKSRVDADKFPMFTATANMELEELAGGYVFSLGITPKHEAFTLFNWIAKNDPDFPTDRPARIGGAAWNDGYSNLWFKWAEEYANAHPDKYDWVNGYLTDFSFIWDSEIHGLKDCDYVYVPIPPHKFMEDYRAQGYEAKFIGSDPHTAFFSMIDKTSLWDEIDGMLFIRSERWYNEEGMIIDLVNQLLDKNHSEKTAAEFRRSGCAYISVKQAYLMLDIIKDAAETAGPENLDYQAIADAAKSWSFDIEGIEDFNSFDATKRYSQNYYAVYEANGSDEIIHRLHPEWLIEATSP